MGLSSKHRGVGLVPKVVVLWGAIGGQANDRISGFIWSLILPGAAVTVGAFKALNPADVEDVPRADSREQLQEQTRTARAAAR